MKENSTKKLRPADPSITTLNTLVDSIDGDGPVPHTANASAAAAAYKRSNDSNIEPIQSVTPSKLQ